MKNSLVAFSVASVLLTSLIIVGTFKTDFVAALSATSTSATSTDAVPTIGLPDTASSSPSSTIAATLAASTTATSTSIAPDNDSATTTANASSANSSANQALPHGNGKPGLKRVHVIGSKYVDFFTDGTTLFSFPGNPSIDANLNKPNAPTPVHAGLTWVSSKAMEAYDTLSGDLEDGTYAQEANGSFIGNISCSAAGATSTAHVAFSLLDPTLDTNSVSPAPKTTEASVPPAPAHPAAADTASTTSSLPDTGAHASSTLEASTDTSASSTAATSVVSTTPTTASTTSTATSTAIYSSVASSSSAASDDSSASTTAATSSAQ